ncbi:hypothetical protein CEXT_42151 [Caerostris extrusa]|uniref:Uncharacterized protein n=1 Tax=Caerostris extrusa TaxID=172846 RepID=A0AAV4SD83_CAEEX|nr:hypothetical protein CEXT_42151 [Caerostris extrusa]
MMEAICLPFHLCGISVAFKRNRRLEHYAFGVSQEDGLVEDALGQGNSCRPASATFGLLQNILCSGEDRMPPKKLSLFNVVRAFIL